MQGCAHAAEATCTQASASWCTPESKRCQHGISANISQSQVADNAKAQLLQPTGQREGSCAWSPLQTTSCSNYLIPQSLGYPSRPRSSQYSLNEQTVYWSFIRVYRGSATRTAPHILLLCYETPFCQNPGAFKLLYLEQIRPKLVPFWQLRSNKSVKIRKGPQTMPEPPRIHY